MSHERVKLIWATTDAEKLIGYMARVSNPDGQDNPDVARLLRYMIDHKHWSPFEMANMCVEIKTTRDISQQIIRHRSFSFQEFSTRFAKVGGYEIAQARRQDEKNRQSSHDDLPVLTQVWFEEAQKTLFAETYRVYEEALDLGIAKECARRILPLTTQTKLYMNGTLRSWIHYIDLRTTPGTQLEHREIALGCREIFVAQFPTIASSLGWT